MGEARLPSTPPQPHVLHSLYRLWRQAESGKLRGFAAWAFSTQPLLPRDTFAEETWGDCEPWFEEDAAKASDIAPLVLAWYRRRPWSDSELAEKLDELGPRSSDATVRDLLATLGEPGRRVLEKWAEERRNKSRSIKVIGEEGDDETTLIDSMPTITA